MARFYANRPSAREPCRMTAAGSRLSLGFRVWTAPRRSHTRPCRSPSPRDFVGLAPLSRVFALHVSRPPRPFYSLLGFRVRTHVGATVRRHCRADLEESMTFWSACSASFLVALWPFALVLCDALLCAQAAEAEWRRRGHSSHHTGACKTSARG